MEELRSWYREHLQAQIDGLAHALSGLRDGSPGAEEMVRGIAHALRGTGATYGFPEVTTAAAAVEEAAADQLVDRLERFLDCLRRAAGADGGQAVLVVEDDEESYRQLHGALADAGFEVVGAGSARRAREVLAQQDVALVLLDLVLPDGDGRELLSALRSEPSTASVPIVVLTVRSGGETRAHCEALGADGFIRKPFDADAVVATVERTLEGTLGRRSTKRDPLTGLLHRAAFVDAFRTGVTAGHGGRPDFLALLDIDRFRSVNDSCGRATGDRVLGEAARLLSGRLGPDDLLARWEGDRFICLLRADGPDEARRRGEELRSACAVHGFASDTGSFRLTLSAGLVEVSPGATLEDALAGASEVLYAAKEGGRDRLVSPGDEADAEPRTILLADDDEATARIMTHRLEAGGFRVIHHGNGAAALAAMYESRPALALLDVNMPAMDGFELLERLRGDPAFAAVPLIMLTARGREEDLGRGFELGADDYIVKPVSPDEVLARVRKLLARWVESRLHDLAGSSLYRRALEEVEAALAAARQGGAPDAGRLVTLARQLLAAADDRGDELRSEVALATFSDADSVVEHSVNVAVLATLVARDMEVDDTRVETVCLAGLLHELGTVDLPDGLLEREEELDEVGLAAIRDRPRASAARVRAMGEALGPVATIVEAVHERLDGSGYPAGLTADEIPLGAQILGAVDVYEACTHRRPYRATTKAPLDGIESMIRMAKEEFSQRVVKAMIRCIGLFPVGSYVQLSNGEVGRVLEHRPDAPMRPLLAVLFDSRGHRLERPKSVDLRLGQPVHVQRSLLRADLEEMGVRVATVPA